MDSMKNKSVNSREKLEMFIEFLDQNHIEYTLKRCENGLQVYVDIPKTESSNLDTKN